jgi:hypothetical protein
MLAQERIPGNTMILEKTINHDEHNEYDGKAMTYIFFTNHPAGAI